jgi:hypothetical protein
MQCCVKIATKSVHYFRRFGATDKRTLTFIYIYIYIYGLSLERRISDKVLYELTLNLIYDFHYHFLDRICGLVVRVLGYRSGGPGSIPGTTRKKK